MNDKNNELWFYEAMWEKVNSPEDPERHKRLRQKLSIHNIRGLIEDAYECASGIKQTKTEAPKVHVLTEALAKIENGVEDPEGAAGLALDRFKND